MNDKQFNTIYMLKRIKILLILFVPFMSFGQDDMAFYCDVMTNAFEADHRDRAISEFNVLFDDYLKQDGSYNQDLAFLKWISVKYPSDKSFRIITWQVQSQNEAYKYYGYIQKANGNLIPLKDRSATMEDPEYDPCDQDYWYGSLYYNMVEKTVDKQKRYFLFGYNGADRDVQIKVIDEMYFEEGIPKFGKKSFKIADGNERPTIKNRLIIDYSEKANVNSNYNESMGMIVHDFVVPSFGISTSGQPVKIPDGTYVGYIWKDNVWNRVNKIEHQISTPESIYYQPKTKSDVDLFGKPSKKRN